MGKLTAIAVIGVTGLVGYLILKPRTGFHYFKKVYISEIDGVRIEGEAGPGGGPKIPIAPGALYGLKMSFRHRFGVPRQVRAFLQLAVGNQTQIVVSEPFDVGADPTWDDYEMEFMSTRGFLLEGLEHCRQVSVRYGLYEGDSDAEVWANTDDNVYHVITQPEFDRGKSRVAQYWSDTGGVVDHKSGVPSMVRIRSGDSFGGLIKLRQRYMGGHYTAKIRLNMQYERWEEAVGEVDVPASENYIDVEIPCHGQNFINYDMPADRRIQVQWQIWKDGEIVLEDTDEEAFIVGDIPKPEFKDLVIGEYYSSQGSGHTLVPIAGGDSYGARSVTFRHRYKACHADISILMDMRDGRYNVMEARVELPYDAEWTTYRVEEAPGIAPFNSYGLDEHSRIDMIQVIHAFDIETGASLGESPFGDEESFVVKNSMGELRNLEADEYWSGNPPGSSTRMGDLLKIVPGADFGAKLGVEHKGRGGRLHLRVRIDANGIWHDVWTEIPLTDHADWKLITSSLGPTTGGGVGFDIGEMDEDTRMHTLKEAWIVYGDGTVSKVLPDWDDNTYVVKAVAREGFLRELVAKDYWANPGGIGAPGDLVDIFKGSNYGSTMTIEHKGGGEFLYLEVGINSRNLFNIVNVTVPLAYDADWKKYTVALSPSVGGGVDFDNNELDIDTPLSCLKKAFIIHPNGEQTNLLEDWDHNCYVFKGALLHGEVPAPIDTRTPCEKAMAKWGPMEWDLYERGEIDCVNGQIVSANATPAPVDDSGYRVELTEGQIAEILAREKSVAESLTAEDKYWLDFYGKSV